MVDKRRASDLFAGEDLRARGLAITALGIVIISPDSLILRLLSVDTWTILAWRGPLTAIGLLGLVMFRYKGEWWSRTRRLGKLGLLVVVLAGASNVFFVTAITHTSVANALVIMAGAPVVAGLLGWMVVGERPNPRTWAAILLVISGVALIVEPRGSSNLMGDLASIGAMLCLAAVLTVTRLSRANDMTPALIGSQALVGLVSIPLAHYAATTPTDFALLAFSGLLMLPLATTLFIAGPRYLPAAEVSLLLPLETVLGTLFVWWFLNEAPTIRTVAGAVVILSTLVIHSYLNLKEARRLRKAQ